MISEVSIKIQLEFPLCTFLAEINDKNRHTKIKIRNVVYITPFRHNPGISLLSTNSLPQRF